MKKLCVKGQRANSLRRAMTRSMVLTQILVLMLFAMVASLPIISIVSSEQGVDASIVDVISAAIKRNDAGDLELVDIGRLYGISRQYPEFWFYAADVDGKSVHMGPLPAEIDNIPLNLTRITSANIADIGTPAAPAAIIRQHESDAGRLWILTAGGPKVGMRMLFSLIYNPVLLGLMALLTVSSILVVPLIVRRQLRGVQSLADEADLIDVNQRGVRLSPTAVPSELHSLVRAINSALERLDEGMERRQHFLADAAHELRTPIAILHTRIELLPDDEDRSRLMLDIARLANLANQLLDLQRIDTDQTTFRPVDLVEMAAQVTSDMAPLAIGAGDEVSFDAERDVVMVSGDHASLSRALTNLIQNAIAHGGAKSIIKVAVGSDGSLRVSDTGPGVAEQYRKAIFEPFHRVVPLDHGAGLGLKLVKDIVDRHNGQVTVGDAPGGGAMFEIRLPLAEKTSAAPSARRKETAPV